MRRLNHGDGISKAVGHTLTTRASTNSLIERPQVQELNWRYRPKPVIERYENRTFNFGKQLRARRTGLE